MTKEDELVRFYTESDQTNPKANTGIRLPFVHSYLLLTYNIMQNTGDIQVSHSKGSG